MKGKLYIVPTPIGNIKDITLRALDILNEVDLVYAEDTRVTKILFSHYNIKTQLYSYHMFNEADVSEQIITKLNQGLNIAMVSDAGMPGISDPGYLIISKAIKEDIEVTVLPGPTAYITAVVGSGMPINRTLFYGFLEHKKSAKLKELEALVDNKETLIFYESPKRLDETIKLMAEVFGNRKVVIARELTKKYEEYIRSTLDELSKQDLNLKGEITIILEGAKIDSLALKLNELDILNHYNYYIDLGFSDKDAMKEVAKDRGISKSVVYKKILEK
ncbi:MAG TPA: 16S rRNA (cytidine(1402)-2'-O)-methyltransferase [Bacilli bacterium]|jgi:16S rRNA (cytidine1402-2'-O)-methyltransferase|nr:16S rRNA (cytidine(1402)-2'-O)-methyltransferase [Bacilli bacterium]HNZ73882.1 16S rRNA (cytidine(1402)-2'-O)-methyltransferase [Bacilli bacterium]HOH58601.1 16S rRNA (cytidine(1402)-2'-O)-methyltransferase [Bacilli bacterium]HPA98677.1 16S rRNA (cytidine(1402)-2'-O)-methyltransferase [Bacilli bacterium]HQB79698.1 16S rRNA (cytidine(1402)-2'-O)-methyltransferase [Bacilli bacterium]